MLLGALVMFEWPLGVCSRAMGQGGEPGGGPGGGPVDQPSGDAVPMDDAVSVRVVEEVGEDGAVVRGIEVVGSVNSVGGGGGGMGGNTGGRGGGPAGVIYRTRREVRDARVIQMPAATIERPPTPATPENPDPPPQPVVPVIPPVRDTVVMLWNELHNLTDERGELLPGEDGKLHPYRAIRLGGAARFPGGAGGGGVPPAGAEEEGDGTWGGGDADGDGVFDAGFVLIGEIDYRIMLRYAEFNPVGLTSPLGGAGVPPASPPLPPAFPELEPWRVGEPPLPVGLSAADVPAYDVDGDGTIDPTGFAGGGCHLYIVQFWTQAIEEYRRAIRMRGGQVREFVENNSYVVEMTADVCEQISEAEFVRGVIPLHPAYRIDPPLIAEMFGINGQPHDEVVWRCAISVFERGSRQRTQLVGLLNSIGVAVEVPTDGGYGLHADLSPAQAIRLLQSDVTLWLNEQQDEQTGGVQSLPGMVCGTGPPVAYELSGIDCPSVAPFNFRGQGVRGATWGEFSFRLNAPDYNRFGPSLSGPPIVQFIGSQDGGPHIGGSHGTSVFGLIFGKDVVTSTGPVYAGVLSDATQGYFGSQSITGGGNPRIPFSEEQACIFDVVFQSSSSGSTVSAVYGTSARVLDDVVFRKDLLVCQMTNQVGQTAPCPYGLMTSDAWCKNVVTIGGVKCNATYSRADDVWGGALLVGTPGIPGAGPSPDGRIKPDLVHVYDGT